jgi:probable F420-dependent oxidoreductase
MTTSTNGVTFASLGALGPAAAPEIASAAQGMGFDAFWVAEANGTESFALLGAAGVAAAGLALGTGVIPVQIRTPSLAAMGAATLQALHPDQDILLGVGVSSPVVAGMWHGAAYSDRPIAQMREYLTLMRELLSGERITFAGDFWSVKNFQLGIRLERRPKLVLAALNAQMLRLGGELADGVLLNYLPSHHVESSIAEIRKGGNADVYALVHAGVGEPEQQLQRAQKDLFGYATVEGYANMFSAAGFAEEISALRAARSERDRAASLAAISPRMCQSINFVGTPSEVREFFGAYRAAGVHHPVLMPLPWGEDRMQVTLNTMAAVAPEQGQIT